MLPAYAGGAPARGESGSLSMLPMLPKSTNSYTLKLPAYAGEASARGYSGSLSMTPMFPKITNSYTLKLPAILRLFTLFVQT